MQDTIKFEDDLFDEIDKQIIEEKEKLTLEEDSKIKSSDRFMIQSKVSNGIIKTIMGVLLRNIKVRVIVSYKDVDIINYEFPKK